MKLGVLRKPVFGARVGTVVQVTRRQVHIQGQSWVAHEITVPGVGVYRLPHKNALPRYVEILE